MTTTSQNRSFPTSRGTVLPLLADDQNRQLLTEWIEGRYEVVKAPQSAVSDIDFDLCIVDDQALAAHRTTLAEKKASEAPAFLPYLLVTRDEDDTTISSQVQEAVDEILTVPTTKSELAWRIANLLKRRHLSRKLRRLKFRSEERFRLVFQAAPDPIVVVSSDGLVTDANEAFCDTFGFDESELNQVPFADLGFRFQETDTDAERDAHRLYWTSPDGDTLVMKLHVSSVNHGDSRTESIGIFRDITETTQRIEELEREQERLQGLHWSRK